MPPSHQDAPQGPGERLRALRLELGFSQSQLLDRCEEIATELGPLYKPFDRGYYSAIENGRYELTKYTQRALLARFFGVSTDRLSEYLEGRLSLDATVAAVRAATAPPPSTGRIGARRWGEHPHWDELCAEAREEDPGLSAETLAELSGQPFFDRPFELMTAHLLAVTARRLQNFRERTPRPR